MHSFTDSLAVLQISFVMGTMLAVLSAYWLGYRPETFNRSIYTGAAIVLFTLRYAIYRVKKWHYYGEHSPALPMHVPLNSHAIQTVTVAQAGRFPLTAIISNVLPNFCWPTLFLDQPLVR